MTSPSSNRSEVCTEGAAIDAVFTAILDNVLICDAELRNMK